MCARRRHPAAGAARCLRPAAQSELRVPHDATAAAAAATARAIAMMRRWAAARCAASRLRAPPAAAAHSAAAGDPPPPPPRPERFAAHGRAWSDEYAWMQRGGAGVEAALAGEAARLARWCAARGVAALAARLEAETLAVLPGASATPPERVGAFEYWAERRDDAPHPRYLRRPIGASTSTDKSSPPEVVLDLNELAAQHGEGVELGELRLSADGASAAFTLAAPGADEARAAFVRDLASGRVQRQAQLGAVVSLEWAADGSTLLYTSPDEGGRPARVLHAAAGNLPGAAPSWRPAGGAGSLIWEESDPAFFLALQRSKDWRVLLLNAHSKSASEVRLVPADEPAAAPLTIAPRREGLEYFVERAHSSLYIMSNAAPAEERALAQKAAGGPSRARNRGAAAAADDAQRALEDGGAAAVAAADSGGDAEASRDYSLFSVLAAAAGGGEAAWRDVFPARPGFALHDLDAFSSALVLHGRDARGAPALAALPLRAPPGGGAHAPDASQAVAAPLPPWALHVEPGANANFGATALRVNLSSPVRPDAAFDWAFGGGGGALAPAARAPALGGDLAAADFSCERLMVPIAGADEDALGGDGSSSRGAPAAFPLTLVRRRDAAATGAAGPCLVVVYGAYGVPLDADFLPERLPLLVRGWSLALVHARGGGELGRRWRAAGRGRGRGRVARGAATAAADDVLAAVDFLAAAGVAAPGRFALEAASAGGVAAGGALAARPRAFGAAALEAPFLDVLSSMLDPGAPLTQHEYGEWGDPRRPEGLDRLLRCCPYANLAGGNGGTNGNAGVDAAAFPPLLLTAARRDARVPFWGPLKYAARLRAAAARAGGARRGEVLVALDAHGGGHWPGEAARPAFRALQSAFLLAAMGAR